MRKRINYLLTRRLQQGSIGFLLLSIIASLLFQLGLNNSAQASAVTGLVDCKFGKAQIFDVQWNISGSNLNISGITSPYRSSPSGGQISGGSITADDYFQFYENGSNFGMKWFKASGSPITYAEEVIHTTGTFRAYGDDFIFYLGGGGYGTVITTGQGFEYGSSATLAITAQNPDNATMSAYVSCGATTLAAGVTRSLSTPAQSSDADLSNLSISKGKLFPTFSSSITSYTTSVAGAADSLTVTATKSDPGASIEVNTVATTSGEASSAIALSTGSNTITVEVTAEDGTTKNYVINVIKYSSSGFGDASTAMRYQENGTPIGTIVSDITDSDDSSTTVAAPFPFNFFGNKYEGLCLTTNGTLSPVATADDDCSDNYDIDLENLALESEAPIIGAFANDGHPGRRISQKLNEIETVSVVTRGADIFLDVTNQFTHGLETGTEVCAWIRDTVLNNGLTNDNYPTDQINLCGQITRVDSTRFEIPIFAGGIDYASFIGNSNLSSAFNSYTASENIIGSVYSPSDDYRNVDDGAGITTQLYAGSTTINGKSAFVYTFYRIAQYDNENPNFLTNTYQIVLIKEDGNSDDGFNFTIEYNYGSIQDADDGYSADDPSSSCSSHSADCRTGVGTADYYLDPVTNDPVVDAYELFADTPSRDLMDWSGETALINNSLNSDVKGRYTFRFTDGRPVDFAVPVMDGTGETAPRLSIPSAPTLTSLTPGDSQLQINFSAPADLGGSAILDYEYSIDGGATWVSIGISQPFVISGLTNGNSYDVVLRAINAQGNSPTSNQLSATPEIPVQRGGSGGSAPEVTPSPTTTPTPRPTRTPLATPTITPSPAVNPLPSPTPTPPQTATPQSGSPLAPAPLVRRAIEEVVDTLKPVAFDALVNLISKAIEEVRSNINQAPLVNLLDEEEAIKKIQGENKIATDTPTAVLINGEPEPARVVVVETNQLHVVAGEGGLLKLEAKDGEDPVPVDSQGRLQMLKDNNVEAEGAGFAAGSEFAVWLFSDPMLLGVGKTDAAGRFFASFPVENEIPLGDHTLQVVGTASSGEQRSISLPVIVLEDKATAVANSIGNVIEVSENPVQSWFNSINYLFLLMFLIIFFALWMIWIMRRRKDEEEEEIDLASSPINESFVAPKPTFEDEVVASVTVLTKEPVKKTSAKRAPAQKPELKKPAAKPRKKVEPKK